MSFNYMVVNLIKIKNKSERLGTKSMLFRSWSYNGGQHSG